MWGLLAIGAYFLLAVNGVADKFLLSKAIRHPVAYAFYMGIAGPLTILLSLVGYLGDWLGVGFLEREFSLEFLSFPDTLIALAAGMCFPFALYFSYKAIQQTSVSRILPIQGGLIPLFTIVFAFLILGERLLQNQLFAFIFLVSGAVLISFKKVHKHWHALAFGSAVISAFLFALSYVGQKYAFGQVNFASGLIWTRFGFFLAAVCFLFSAEARQHIFNTIKEISKDNVFVYVSARLSGGLAGLMHNYAIKIGSVTLVNALQGTQYIFLLALTSILSLRYPKILKEHISGQTMAQKIVSIILISLGLAFLVL